VEISSQICTKSVLKDSLGYTVASAEEHCILSEDVSSILYR